MLIDILSNVKSKNNPRREGIIVDKKECDGQFFYRILWNDSWESGGAVFYEEKDFEVLS